MATNTPKIALIDIKAYQEFVDILKPDVIPIKIDRSVDTYSTIIDKIRAAVGSGRSSHLVLAQHNYLAHMKIAKEPIIVFAKPTSWEPLLDFLLSLKELGIHTVDFLACMLYSQAGVRNMFATLETASGLNLRASTNNTGSSAGVSSDWIMESDLEDISQIYFSESIINYKNIFYTYTNSSNYGSNKLIRDSTGKHIHPARTRYNTPVNSRFDVSGNPKYIIPGGTITAWGDTSVPSNLTNIKAVYSTEIGYAALKTDNTLIVWGGSYSPPSNLINIKTVATTSAAFAALKYDGSVIIWGDPDYGGINNTGANLSAGSGIKEIYSNGFAFAALYNDGSVSTWGYDFFGGVNNSFADLSNVIGIYSTQTSFAALHSNKSVSFWGYYLTGGDYVGSTPLTDIDIIYSTAMAFAAKKTNGTLIIWGSYDMSTYIDATFNNIIEAIPNFTSFAMITSAYNLQTWGDPLSGGDYSNSSITDIVCIYASESAFAALTRSLTVYTWGNISASPIDNVVTVYSSTDTFAALKFDGSVIAWGAEPYNIPASASIINIFANYNSFAALKSDRTLITWGATSTTQDISNVTTIYSDAYSFLALSSSSVQPENHIPVSTYLPCFTAGTRILTPTGEVPVETLKTGDIIVSADERRLPIKLYSTYVPSTNKTTAPYIIPKNAFGKNTPNRDLYVSGKHAVQSSKDIWQIPEFYGFKQTPSNSPIWYYHIELPNYFTDNIIANGVVCESLAGKQVDKSEQLYKYSNKAGGFIRTNKIEKSVCAPSINT